MTQVREKSDAKAFDWFFFDKWPSSRNYSAVRVWMPASVAEHASSKGIAECLRREKGWRVAITKGWSVNWSPGDELHCVSVQVLTSSMR